jgi:acyl-CoA dehydrogenase family protein 9
VGGAKMMIRMASEHATTRQQFGKPILSFGLIQEKLGRMMMETFVTESISYLTCGLVDFGIEDYSIESAISKITGSETIWFVANEAMQIAGGSSYMQEYPYERILRDSRINLIFEGTNEILRLFIALSGMKNIGEHLKIVGEALNNPIKSLGVLYDYFIEKNLSRSLHGDQVTMAHSELKREVAMFEEDVLELENAVEKAIRKHRKEIWEKQFAQKRIAEIAMDLYRMIAVISRTTGIINTQGVQEAKTEITMTEAYCLEAHHRIEQNLRGMDKNVDEHIKEIANVTGKELKYFVEGVV